MQQNLNCYPGARWEKMKSDAWNQHVAVITCWLIFDFFGSVFSDAGTYRYDYKQVYIFFAGKPLTNSLPQFSFHP